ncbi:MAG: DUF2867 domain-containing protein [Pseudomonadota bacterium]
MSAQPQVDRIELPSDSRLRERIQRGDFLDCFAVTADATPRQAAEIITEFPGWARGLLQIRRLVTLPFGLSQDGPDAPDKVGAFPVESETDDELIAGFNDKHLDFRVSVMARQGRVSLATWVHVHNIGGRIYLSTILPVHVMVARDALRRVAIRTSGPRDTLALN